jgi:uncharacterized protein YggU (UPF0235/DUF167 family)
LVKFVANTLAVSKSLITIVDGETLRSTIVEIVGVFERAARNAVAGVAAIP